MPQESDLPSIRQGAFILHPFEVTQDESRRVDGWRFVIRRAGVVRAVCHIAVDELDGYAWPADRVTKIDRMIYAAVQKSDHIRVLNGGLCCGQISGFPD